MHDFAVRQGISYNAEADRRSGKESSEPIPPTCIWTSALLEQLRLQPVRVTTGSHDTDSRLVFADLAAT